MSRRVQRVNPKVLGAGVLALFVGSVAFAFNAHEGVPFADYRTATASFSDLAGLRPRDDVRIGGVRVGQVTDLDYVDGQAQVAMQLPGDLELHRDASAQLVARSALGQKYVQLDPGTPGSGPLDPAHIPIGATSGVVELDQVLDTLDEPTRDALRTAVREAGTGAAGRGRDLNDVLAAAPDLLEDTAQVSEVLADPGTGLALMLDRADRLAARFAGREDDLASLADQLAVTLEAFDPDGGSLQRTLAQAPATLDAARPALDTVASAAGDARIALAELQPGAAALGRGFGDVRGVLREAVGPLERVPGLARDVVPALDEVEALVADARPLAPKLRRAIGLARPALDHLAPYAPELVQLFTRWGDATSHGDANGNWWRFTMAPPGSTDAPAFAPVPTPLRCTNKYPAPGEASGDRAELGALGGC